MLNKKLLTNEKHNNAILELDVGLMVCMRLANHYCDDGDCCSVEKALKLFNIGQMPMCSSVD
jgi:hypothetical protein